MIQKRQILVNALMSVIQVVLNGVILLILYRFLLNTIGVEQLGIWAIVLSTTSVASVASSGLSGSVVKFVAKYKARGQDETVSRIIQTATISIGVILGFILLAVYPFANWLLGLVISTANLGDALSILPYALLSLWITSIAAVFQSSLDGYQRIDLRSILLIASSLCYLLLCFLMVPVYALMGLAYAQVVQAFILLIGSWFLLKRNMRSLPILPFKWDRKLFSEIVVYGLNFQVISISQMFYDPITKALLTKFGGLAMTGYYEMARGMIYQLRALLVSATQVLVPTIADLQEKNPKSIQKIYKDSYCLLFFIAVPFFSLIIILTPIMSQLWIGQYENLFVRFSILLAVGWFISTLTVPASSVILGIGKLRWYVMANVVIGVLNLGLGLLLGNIYGGTAVVAAWVFSLSLGSLIVPISYHYSYKIPMIELLPKESAGIGLASIAGLSICMVLYYQLELTPLAMAAILVLIFLSIVVIPFLLHPMRKRLMGWVNMLFMKETNFSFLSEGRQMEKFTSEETKDFVSKPLFDEKTILSKDSSWPKISIITICYNHGQFIERTILSVLNQNYPNVEYIIIDGGSTDDSVEIIKKYEKYLAYFASERDGGTSDAINKGFLKSTGHIIGLQNSDDTYLPQAFFKAVDYYKKYPDTDILFGNRLDVDVEDNIIGEGRFTPFCFIGHYYEGMALSVQSVFFKKSLLSKIGMYDTESWDYPNDYEFFIRAGLNKVRFKHVRYYFGAMRRHKAARTSIGWSPTMIKDVDAIYKFYGRITYLAWFLKVYSLLRRSVYYFLQGDLDYLFKGFKRRAETLINRLLLGCHVSTRR